MTQHLSEQLAKMIRDVPDFPKKGIIFKDITPVLNDPALFELVINDLKKRYTGKNITKVVGIESRGFIFGAALALVLGVGFVPIRKKGKLPYKTLEASYELEYGSATIEMHVDAISHGDRVVMVDDLLATGGTAEAACKLVEGQGAEIVECAFVVELDFLNGREKLKREVYSQVRF